MSVLEDEPREEQPDSPGPIPKSITSIYEEAGKGYKVSVTNESASGKTQYGYTTNADGTDAKLTGNNPNADTIAVRRIDANTLESISKMGGKTTITQRNVLSADGSRVPSRRPAAIPKVRKSTMSRCSRGSSGALLVLVILSTSVVGILAQTGAGGETVPVELSTVGLDGRTGTPIVVLREPVSGAVLPIWVGVMEAQAIALALHGVVTPRPMTHDLMASLIAELRAESTSGRHRSSQQHVFRNGQAEGRGRTENPRRRQQAQRRARAGGRTGAPIRVAKKILAIAPAFDFVAPDGPNQVVQAMGMTVVLATASLRKQFKLGDLPGIVVTSAYGAARDKGVRRGDLITNINGKGVEEPADLFDAVRATKPRAPVRVTYWRNGETRTIELPADLPPANPGKSGRVTA